MKKTLRTHCAPFVKTVQMSFQIPYFFFFFFLKLKYYEAQKEIRRFIPCKSNCQTC